jgi:hypothetical protein
MAAVEETFSVFLRSLAGNDLDPRPFSDSLSYSASGRGIKPLIATWASTRYGSGQRLLLNRGEFSSKPEVLT